MGATESEPLTLIGRKSYSITALFYHNVKFYVSLVYMSKKLREVGMNRLSHPTRLGP